MAPLDRYRKHYLIFDYWNDELLEALQGSTPNMKLCRRASAEALGELTTLQGFLADEVAVRLAPMVEERVQINDKLQRGSVNPSETNLLWRQLERQARQIHRDFFWRDVEDHLKP